MAKEPWFPRLLQDEALEKLYAGHQGIVRSKLRTKISDWWPGLTRCLTSFVSNCPECARDAKKLKEPLIPSTLPNYPWLGVAADLFHLKGGENIYCYCILFLMVSGREKAEDYHLSKCHQYLEDNVLELWYTGRTDI